MAFHSLRARLLVIQSALVVGLTVVTLAYVSMRANRAVAERFTEDLTRSRDAIASAVQARYTNLDLLAQFVASFPDLRGLFLNTDAATIRDFLSEFRQSHSRQELLVALDSRGKVLSRSDTFAPLQLPDVEHAWLTPALSGHSAVGELLVDNRLYLSALVAAQAGGNVFGFVLAGSPVDETLARAVKDASDREIVILSPQGIVASTLPMQRLPWRTSADLAAFSADAGPQDVNVEGEHFQGVLVTTPRVGSTVRIVSLESRILSLQSRDRALAPYRSIQIGLLVLGLLAAAAGITGSAVLARSLTAPIGSLVHATREVAAGNLNVPLAVSRDDEIGHLARSFQQMTEGLREREAMQKFISQSTVAMIHDRPAAPRAGERRTLTLLFSDIRDFTRFAEGRPPEEAVQVLNRYLHLQADLVKRFHGDVDKFIGDAVFAHFTGADRAFDAIRCAVEIQRAVEAASRTDSSLPALSVGIGIATGDVIIGSIGSDDRLDYTAIGPAVNLSFRLCSVAEPQEILMNEETFAMVRGLVGAEPVPPLTVKGFSAPVQAYRMVIRQSVGDARV
jgi:class 3 adenylate cyclase